MERLNGFKNKTRSIQTTKKLINFEEIVKTDMNKSIDSETMEMDCSTPTKDPTLASNMFKCNHCPFVCNQLIRLSRHENKHFVKAEHQVL